MQQELNTGWVLKQAERKIEIPFIIPGDVHSALLDAGIIEEPYYRDNEYAVDWVHQQAWTIERFIELDTVSLQHQCILRLDQVDCIACIRVNNVVIANIASQFLHYSFNITTYLRSGTNAISITFDSASIAARKQADAFPFELPFLDWNCRVPHTNMLRKTPCHAGWDWNICLMPIGIYGKPSLEYVQTHWVEDIQFEQQYNGDDVTLRITATLGVVEAATLKCQLSVAGVSLESNEHVQQGEATLSWSLDVKNPQRWWPAGSGAQKLYPIIISIGEQQVQKTIGFRQVSINRAPDKHGSGFEIVVNEKPLFMRGANWIPADALPQRITMDSVRELLQSVVDANMNMLRVWGGGQYEPDWFYDLCDEMGILVWQDFMFSCNHYPAACPDWLALVKREATQQVRRLSSHPCLALWCGDNELVGALNWWDVTRNNRDRYLANYSRLNHTLEKTTQAEISDVDFWPSSPSSGFMDFGDGWKNDAAGDMHFWDVWHEAKPFSAYQDIHPRFCSEFGFQSFPSMPIVNTFTKLSDQNVSSPIMEVHQRNQGGNARIVETLVRYFEFPNTFDRMVFLSQCQQAMAIKTAVEYWRSLKPHCMGTLFWQLNDTWPVASWASLEYGGGWKLLQYAARRFYQPVLVAMVPGHKRFNSAGELQLKVISDFAAPIDVQIELSGHDVNGQTLIQRSYSIGIDADAAALVDTMESNANEQLAFYRFHWQVRCEDKGVTDKTPTVSMQQSSGTNEYWLKPYKAFDLPTPRIQATQSQLDGKECVSLQTDTAAYYVSLGLGGNRVFSDNGFTLLPGETKQVLVERVLENPRAPKLKELKIEHL